LLERLSAFALGRAFERAVSHQGPIR
jgi:hypothetical protein